MRPARAICVAFLFLLTACESTTSSQLQSYFTEDLDKLSDHQIQLEIDRLLQRRLFAQQNLGATTHYRRYRYIKGVDQVEARQKTFGQEDKDDSYYESLICEIDSELKRFIAENDRRLKLQQEAMIDTNQSSQ